MVKIKSNAAETKAMPPLADRSTCPSMDTAEDYGVEAELTSLSWLQSLDITSASSLSTPPCSPSPPPVTRQPVRKLSPLVKAELDLAENAEKYRADPDAKPPFSYATIICLAMRANNNKVSLSNIYAWIRENFLYYKYADPAWQNSIRHNLSLNKCFVKLPRSKEEPGKGGFWKLDLERMEEGKRTRRRSTMSHRCRSGAKREQSTQPTQPTQSFQSFQSSQSHVPSKPTVMTRETDSAVTTTSKAASAKTSGKTTARTRIIDGQLANSCQLPPTSCLSASLYETPPSSVSPPIPDGLPEVVEPNQVSLSEDDLTGLLIATAGWDENQLDLLDSLLDTL